jgi:hypothetical protein
MAIACFRSVTFGPCLEPECSEPSLNLDSSLVTRFCCAFFGAFGFSFGMATSGLEEGQQIGVELIRVRVGETVRAARVDRQRLSAGPRSVPSAPARGRARGLYSVVSGPTGTPDLRTGSEALSVPRSPCSTRCKSRYAADCRRAGTCSWGGRISSWWCWESCCRRRVSSWPSCSADRSVDGPDSPRSMAFRRSARPFKNAHPERILSAPGVTCPA